jgi:hypothetical protein
MNRKEKYRNLRIIRRVTFAKTSLLMISVCCFFLFALSLTSVGTYSYFTADYTATMGVKNATKEDLVSISEGDLIYEEKCLAKQPVTVKNVFDYLVKISIDGTEYNLSPGQTITHPQIVADNCGEFGERTFDIIGYENYFDHPITVFVDKNKLNPPPPPKPCPDPAIENANGKENDNGNGKHCGNQGNPQHDGGEEQNSNQSQEVQPDKNQEGTKVEPVNEEAPVTETEVNKKGGETTQIEEQITEPNKEENNSQVKEVEELGEKSQPQPKETEIKTETIPPTGKETPKENPVAVADKIADPSQDKSTNE